MLRQSQTIRPKRSPHHPQGQGRQTQPRPIPLRAAPVALHYHTPCQRVPHQDFLRNIGRLGTRVFGRAKVYRKGYGGEV